MGMRNFHVSSNGLILANLFKDFNKYMHPQIPLKERSCHGSNVLLNVSWQSSSFLNFLHHYVYVKHILNI